MRPFFHSMRTSRRPTGAFTVVEIVIVLMIMGVFAAVAVPAFVDSILYHRVESAARRVAADLRLVRQIARRTSAPQTMTFDGGSQYTLSGAVHLDRPGEPYVVDLGATPFHISDLSVDFDGDLVVEFDGYGTPSAPGTIVLGASDYQRTLTLDAVTGEVTIN